MRKIGDTVNLKTIEQLIAEFGIYSDGSIKTKPQIIPEMFKYFGKKYKITDFFERDDDVPFYFLDNMIWKFSEDMFEEEEVVLVTRANVKTGIVEEEWILTKEALKRRKEEFKDEEETHYYFKYFTLQK